MTTHKTRLTHTRLRDEIRRHLVETKNSYFTFYSAKGTEYQVSTTLWKNTLRYSLHITRIGWHKHYAVLTLNELMNKFSKQLLRGATTTAPAGFIKYGNNW